MPTGRITHVLPRWPIAPGTQHMMRKMTKLWKIALPEFGTPSFKFHPCWSVAKTDPERCTISAALTHYGNETQSALPR